jgi:hypothetical protein
VGASMADKIAAAYFNGIVGSETLSKGWYFRG